MKSKPVYTCPSLSVLPAFNPETKRQELRWTLEGDWVYTSVFSPIKGGFQLSEHANVYTVLSSLTDGQVYAVVIKCQEGAKVKTIGKVSLPLDRIASWVSETIGREAWLGRRKTIENVKINELATAYHYLYGTPFVRYECGAKAAGLERLIAQFESDHGCSPEIGDSSISMQDDRKAAWSLPAKFTEALSRDWDADSIGEIFVDLPWDGTGSTISREELLQMEAMVPLWPRLDAVIGKKYNERFPDCVRQDVERGKEVLRRKLAGTLPANAVDLEDAEVV
jgi:hypothetical protein